MNIGKLYKSIFILFILLILLSPKLTYGFELTEDTPPIHGFIEHSSGFVFRNPKTKHENYNMMEQRLQLKTRYYPKGDNIFNKWRSTINFKGEFLVDEYFGGKTDFNLREMNILFTPTRMVDVRLGRQILTWGTGDYLFINDMFPKNYVS